MAKYIKLNNRLKKHFASGRFARFTRAKQARLIERLERIKGQLLGLEGLKQAGSALALGLVLCSSQLEAQVVPSGSEFQVNTYTTNNQLQSSIAMDSDGDFVITWHSDGQDGNSYGIYAQRYNATGVAQGSEFRVNTYTTNGQSNPSIAMDSDGDFVITWMSNNQDGSGFGIYAQRFNSAGVAQGSEFRVNTFTTYSQNSPSIAIDSDGDFAISWTSYKQDGSFNGIYAKRYNASGVVQGSEFLVNSRTSSAQGKSSIDMDSDGDFVITWSSYNQDGSNYGIYAQRFNSGGVAQGSEFIVNSQTASSQDKSSVAIDSDGDFVVIWQSSAQDGSSYGVYAQRYNATGVAQGSEFRVNTITTYSQNSPSVVMDSDGDFVIAWNSYNQDGSSNGVYAQRYNASGLAQGSEFLVNTRTANSQDNPSICMNSDSNFIIAWNSDGQDGDLMGIYAQRFTSGPTSVLNETDNSTLILYPNPATNWVMVNLDGTVSVRVFDLSGTLVKEGKLIDQRFNFEGLKSGSYLIEFTQEGNTITKALLVE